MNVLGLTFLVVFIIALIAFRIIAHYAKKPAALRRIDALYSIPDMVGNAVETGRRIHVSLGSGVIGREDTATTLAGLTVLDQISSVAVVSDKPPVVTSADGTTMFLAQDTLRHIYTRQNAAERYDPSAARVVGISPAAYGAELTTLVKDESVAGNILIGPVGPEAVLLAEASARAEVPLLAGSHSPATQALLFAATENALYGEDVYAAGAVIGRDPAHVASLQAQDVMRVIVILAIVFGALLKMAGVL